MPDGRSSRPRTLVTIIGAGPAGLLLGCLLQGSGRFDCTIVENRTRAYVEARQRAGLMEHRSVELLRRHGLADRLLQQGHQHDSCEFRIDGSAVVVKFGPLAGATQYVWPQHELVIDLIGAFLARGGRVHFDVTDVALDALSTNRPRVSFRDPAAGATTLISSVVVGADGFHGVSRTSVPARALRCVSHEMEFSWVAVLAQTPPSAPHIIYAPHDRGFAGHMLRTPYGPTHAGAAPPSTRFYLQCARGEHISSWPDTRIWDELQTRLGSVEPTWALRDGPITDKTVLPMRSFVAEPMRYDRLFLIGDVAHTITPVGAKGMNLALNDARVLYEALLHWTSRGDESALTRFSATCLHRVWQSQAFSNWLTHLIHQPRPDAPDSAFHARLRRTRLDTLLSSETELGQFARAYVGVD